MLTICNVMSASVGNSIVEKDEYQNYGDLLIFSALFSVILSVSTALLACLYQSFMRLWIGENLLLSTFNMFYFAHIFT